MSEATQSAQPGLRAAQAGSNAPDDMMRTVNLFRGQVVMPLELVSLPGRNGLDLGLTAIYSSAVAHQVEHRNSEAPTGLLGVGWSLGHERIVLGDRLVALPEQQRAYLVDATGVQPLDRVSEEDGVVSFQSREFQFWRIELHDAADPARASWQVTREDGSVRRFGGPGAVEWGAAWDGWVGPSTALGASAFPVAWDLAEIRSFEGDRIAFAYDADEVEIGGVAVTRATRLARAVDVLGRSVELSYREKEPFENELPEVPPGGGAAAYQLSFQTHYLDAVTVRERDGAVTFRQQLGYELYDVLAGAGEARPHYTKRYLTSVRQELPGERRLPALTLRYERDPGAAAPGALRGQTAVGGAEASYAYAPSPVAHSSTSLGLEGPPDRRPRVWHGPGFTVVTWERERSGDLEVWVCSWSGSWRVWREEPLTNVIDLAVSVGEDFFALRYTDRGWERPALRLYHQDPYRLGTWSATDVSLGPEFADLRMATGRDFVALQGKGMAAMRIVRWDALRKGWREQDLGTPGGAPQVALGGGDGFVLGAFQATGSDQLRLQIFFAGLDGEWRAGGYADVNQPIDWDLTRPDSVWAAGAAFGAATFVTGTKAGTVSAAVALVRWREDYALADLEVQEVTQPTDARNPILYSALADAVVGHAGDVVRFDAGRWLSEQLLEPEGGNEYRYAYGSDLALAAELEGGEQRFHARRFDPYSGRWTGEGAPASEDLPGDGGLALPAIAGRYALLGRSVYARAADDSWERVHQLPETAIGGSCALRSGYLSYQRSGQTDTDVVFLADGGAREGVLTLAGERSYVPEPGPGEVLAGADTLVTYRGEELAGSRQLTLHRVLDAAMPETPEVAVVTEMALDDGYQRRVARFEYEDEGAALDAGGATAQFTRTTLRWPSDLDRGRTVHTYYNGLEPDEDGAFYPPDGPFSNARRYLSLLSGQIWKSEAYGADDELASRVENLFWTYDRAAGPPGAVPTDRAEDEGGANLAGAYMRPRRVERTLVLPREADGARVEVTSTETYDHNELGQVAVTTEFNLAPDGSEERLQTRTTYAWEVYEELAAAHQLAPVAQTERRNEGTGVVTAVDVNTYVAAWPSCPEPLWAQRDAYRWRGEAGSGPFDFESWSDLEQAPPGWLRTSRVLDRTPAGTILEQRDVDGVHASFVLDRDGIFEVARLDATSRGAGEGWYWGFEAYEDPGPWRAAAAATIVGGTAFAGRRCLRVPGAAGSDAALTASFAGAEETGSLLIACRSQTPPGSGGGAIDAVWRVSAGGVTREHAARASDGDWRLWHVPLHPADFGLERFDRLEVELVNREPGLELLLDGLFLNPLIGAAGATVVSEPHGLEIAGFQRLGPLSRQLFDGLRRPLAAIGEGCESTVLTATHDWRRDDGDRFDPARPGFDLRTSVRAAGSFLDPVQGEGYRSRWEASGDWSREGGQLRHGGEGEGRLLSRWTRSRPTFALAAHLTPAGNGDEPYGLLLGGARIARLEGRWVLLDAAGAELAAAAGEDGGELLVLGSDVGVQLLVDGQPLIEAKTGPLAPGPLGVFANGPLLISHLLVADGVATEATYRDNQMRPRQEQAQREDGVTATAVLHDGAARPAVRTRPAALAGRLLGFIPDLVTAFDWESGLLEGAAADAYPDDEGYPYGRHRYDATPLERPLETGLPGRRLAIDERVPESERRTQRTLYEATGAAKDALALPAGGFSVTTTIDQDGLRTRSAVDRLGRPVREVRDNASDPGTAAETRAWRYDEAGRLRELALPNSFDSSRPDADRFRERFFYDFLGRLIGREQPDMEGMAESVYDAAGRVRFAIDGAGHAAGRFTYCRYDRLGRLLEDGVCAGQWDRGTLAAKAEQRDWLPPGAEALNRRVYDGDGSDPTAIGGLIEAVARAPGAAAGEEVRESFGYDAFGRTVRRTQEVDPDGGADQVEFAYDLRGEVSERRHLGPDGAAFAVNVVRDAFGAVVRLQGRAGADPAEPFAAYAYTAEGQLREEILAPAATPLQRAHEYGPAGWATKVSDPLFSQRLDYGGSDAGRVTGSEESFATPPPLPGFVDGFKTTVEHDGHGRLRSVANSAGAGYGLGTVAPLQYDRNGNLVSLSRGDAVQRHRFAAGTNQLVAVEGNGGGEYAYDGNGALQRATPLGIAAVSRHPSGGQPLAIELDDGSDVGFRYAADGRRLLDREASGSVVSVHDEAGRLLARRWRADGSWQTVHYLQGPAGLAAARAPGRSLFVLRDRLGSVRGVYDGERLVAAASYQPLGEALGARWIDPDLARLLPQGFTGQQDGPPEGLVLFPARMYDPFVSRFDRLDPAGRHPSPYAYAGGDPLDFVDPNGEDLLGALLGILVGAALIVGGVAAIIFSGGAATPGVAAAWSLGGSFLVGAGTASAAYGFGQIPSGTEFKPGEWLGLTALGGLFGAISGGASIAVAAAGSAIGSAARAFAIELALGVATGAADGFISNGVVNVNNRRDFGARWAESLLGGAFGGATGGFFGRAIAWRNVRTLSRMGVRQNAIDVYRTNSGHWPSHSLVNFPRRVRVAGGVYVSGAYEQTIAAAPAPGGGFPTFWERREVFVRGAINNRIMASIHVNRPAARAAAEFAAGPRALPNYSYLSNTCTTTVIDVVEQTGLIAPPWAYSPTTLVYWAKRLPQ